jgi:serine/threonine-protein kinase RsbW
MVTIQATVRAYALGPSHATAGVAVRVRRYTDVRRGSAGFTITRSGYVKAEMGDGMQNGLSRNYPAVADSIHVARHELSAFASATGASSQQIDAVRLASSEALTNAVIHAYRDKPGQIHVTAAVVSQDLWIVIADDGCGLEPRTDRPGLGLGLGLGLIAQLTDDFSIASRSRGGVEVRMRFALAGRHAAERPQALGSTDAASAPSCSRFSTTA